jgi:polyhydroxyalkanoate synthase
MVLATTLGACASHPIHLKGEISHPKTADGWPLTLEHLPPEPGAPRRTDPVILCHGFLANRTYFKLNEERSLAAMLRAAGYDVWLLDLRGREAAGAPSYYFGERTYSYAIDDFIKNDIDTAITHVLKKTGAQHVSWIGHSMGGMIAYARIGSFGEERIARLVTIGSPGVLPLAGRTLMQMYSMSGGLAVLAVVPVAPFAQIKAETGLPFTPQGLIDMLWYPPNVEPQIEEQVLRHTATNLSKGEARQFLRAFEDGEFVSKDGATDYSRNLKNVRVPVLLVAGRRDNLGDPSSIRAAYERVGSEDKTLVMAERSRGFSEDYGHTDLLVGRRAHREIHPRIIAWLTAHDGR